MVFLALKTRISRIITKQLGDEAGLFEAGDGMGGQSVEFGKERIVLGFEVKAGLALHVGPQLFRHGIEQLGVRVDSHQMIAHVAFADLDPGDRY